MQLITEVGVVELSHVHCTDATDLMGREFQSEMVHQVCYTAVGMVPVSRQKVSTEQRFAMDALTERSPGY